MGKPRGSLFHLSRIRRGLGEGEVRPLGYLANRGGGGGVPGPQGCYRAWWASGKELGGQLRDAEASAQNGERVCGSQGSFPRRERRGLGAYVGSLQPLTSGAGWKWPHSSPPPFLESLAGIYLRALNR